MLSDGKGKIIDYKVGDITGNGIEDEIYIMSCSENKCINKHWLVIKEISSGKIFRSELEEDNFKFEIRLVNFKSGNKKDIFLRSIGNCFGGCVNGQVFTCEDEKLLEIFNTNEFYKQNKINAFYRENYEVEVLNYERNKKYFVDIRENFKYYLDFVYDNKGKVKDGKDNVNISSVWECFSYYPMGSNTANLSIKQKVLGQSDTDTICLVESILRWSENSFTIIDQVVDLKGNFINQNYRNKEICIEEGCFTIIDMNMKKDSKITDAIKKIMNLEEDNFRYIRYDLDLNGDGENEVFIYLRDWYFCNNKGCRALVLKEKNGEYEVIGNFAGVSYPIIISDKNTNGYKDLIMYISGLGILDGYRIIKFEGEEYNKNIFLQPVVPIDDIKKENIHGNLLKEYNENDRKIIVDTKTKRTDLVDIVKRFINKESEILFANEVNIDKTGNKEIIAAYRYAKGLYLILLEEVNGEWGLVDIIKGKGYGVEEILIVPLELDKKSMVVVWKLSDTWNKMDVYKKDKYGIYDYLTIEKPFNSVDIRDIDNDGVFEIAIWNRDSDDAYKVEVYRLKNNTLIVARDLYEKYFSNLVKYYSGRVKENPTVPLYWYYLADSQFITRDLKEALKSINMNLSFQYPYPSKEEAFLLKDKIELALNKIEK